MRNLRAVKTVVFAIDLRHDEAIRRVGKERRMVSKRVICGALASMLLVIPEAYAAAPARGSGAMVIIFKDGQRQMFNLGEIDRVEFPGTAASDAGAGGAGTPTRGHYVGKWECGDGAGGTFVITLKEGGQAERTLHAVKGKWAYVNGEARVTWDDGKLDLIRKVGSRYEKVAFHEGKSFSDQPDNIAGARLMTEKPI